MSIEDNTRTFEHDEDGRATCDCCAVAGNHYHPKSFFDAAMFQSGTCLAKTIVKFAEATVIFNESKRLYQKRVRNDPTILPEYIQKRYAAEIAEELEVEEEKVEVVPYFWVTISAHPDTDVQKFKAKAIKAFSKKWITSVKFAFEIGDGGNPHVHALVGYDVVKNRSDAITEFARTFKCLGVTKNNVDVKPLSRLHMKNNLFYMCKNKPQDITWRRENYLPAFVQSDNFEERTNQYLEEEVDGCLSPLATASTALAATIDSEGDMWDQGSLTPDPSSP